MKLSAYLSIARVQLSAEWDGHNWLMVRPVVDVGRSKWHRAWQFVWLRGNIRAEIRTSQADAMTP